MKTIKYKRQRVAGHLIAACLYIFLLPACGGDVEHGPLGSGNESAPGPVKNVIVENTPGGAILTYELPGNVDLQYVKAVYTLNGVQREAIASAYINQVKVEGFGDIREHEVELYAVNRMGKSSVPVKQTINPLMPPILQVQQTLQAEVDFGGFVISFENSNKAEIAIYALKRDTINGNFVDHDALYTSLDKGIFTVRNLPNKTNDFGMYVVDRWNNYSDTIFFSLTPWKEDYLDKKLFRTLNVSGDVGWNFYNGTPEKAFNDVVSNGDYAHTNFPEEFPHRYTLDLGVSVKLSRFMFWQRPGDDVLYQHGAPKVYNVYGSSDVSAGWTLLMTCHSFKPSGLPVGQNSSEDVEYGAKGEEFSFPRDILPIRYLRFEMLESWSGMKCSTIGEVAFYGDIQ